MGPASYKSPDGKNTEKENGREFGNNQSANKDNNTTTYQNENTHENNINTTTT